MSNVFIRLIFTACKIKIKTISSGWYFLFASVNVYNLILPFDGDAWKGKYSF